MTHNPVLRTLLWPASLLFGLVVRLRAWLYRAGVFRQERLRGVVISVGNLTVGGTGKTPMVIWLAQRLLAEGKRVGILTRGYRGFAGTSDEVELLRARLRGIEIGVGGDRFTRGRELEQKGIDWLVLDDGFQHLRLVRDVDIVLLDAADPFGAGCLLPAGRLREPKSALARADAVVITRSEHAPAVEAVVRRYTQAPIFYAQNRLEGIALAQTSVGDASASAAAARHLFAFCAIGNPGAFLEDLRRWAMRVVGHATFRDHHRYTLRDAERLERMAQAVGAEALICTEKDIHNLRAIRFKALPLFYCQSTLDVLNAEAFWRAILAIIERKRAGAAR